VPRFLALGCLRSGLLYGVYLRSLAARALISWQLLGDPSLDPPAVAEELLRHATGAESAGRLCALDLASAVHPAHWASLFLHETASAQVREHLRREHGRIMGDRRTGEMLVECFWRHGQLIPVTDAVRAATGAALSEAGLIAELERATSA
jgi:hypothetical protein